MEMAAAYFEEDFFEHVSDSRVPKPIDYPNTEHNSDFVSGLKRDGIAQGPGKIIKVAYGDKVEVSTYSYYRSDDAGQTTGQTIAEIMADMLVNIAAVGGDIMPAGEIGVGQFTNPSSPSSQAVSSFMSQELSDYDPSVPQAYLVYLFFDEKMKFDPTVSGLLRVADSDVLEEHKTQTLVMRTGGYFYTYVTNRSTKKVNFDNLRIVHLQGQVRARYDYYSYGLMWNQPVNPYDQTYGLKEWQMKEWGEKGIELYQFEARMYDPVVGRWGAPDPLEQFHSPYLANFNNPANFVDPDGRNGKFWQFSAKLLPVVNIFVKGSAGSSAVGKLDVDATISGGAFLTLRILTMGMEIRSLISNNHDLQVQQAQSTTAGAGSGSPNWHRDGAVLRSHGGDNVETLLAYLDSEGYDINYDDNNWNNGQPTKPGIHKYEVYNILKAAGYADADLDPDNDIAVPVALIEFVIAQRAAKPNLAPSDHPIAQQPEDDLEGLHTALTVLGLVPIFGEVFDGVNAVIYLCEGDYVNAAGAVVCMTVGAGTAVALAKLGEKAATKAITKAAIEVTEASIAKALEGSTMKTLQAEVSLPAVQRYVKMLEDGLTPPPIKVADGVIIEGNHRYVAGRIFGVEPPIVPGVLPPSQVSRVVPIQQTKVNPLDWNNH